MNTGGENGATIDSWAWFKTSRPVLDCGGRPSATPLRKLLYLAQSHCACGVGLRARRARPPAEPPVFHGSRMSSGSLDDFIQPGDSETPSYLWKSVPSADRAL